MICVECSNDKNLRSELVTKKYKECGLDNITLHGIEQYHCSVCGADYFKYGDIEKLHELIAHVLLRKADLLTGQEVRFLRKHLGYSTTMFSNLLGYEQETISRLENGKTKVQPSFDHLVRAMVATKTPDRDYDLHDILLNKAGETYKRVDMFKKGKSWEVKLAS